MGRWTNHCDLKTVQNGVNRTPVKVHFACFIMLIWLSNPILWALDSFEYPQHRVCFNNEREIAGKRAEYPSLSGPLGVKPQSNPESILIVFTYKCILTLLQQKMFENTLAKGDIADNDK